MARWSPASSTGCAGWGWTGTKGRTSAARTSRIPVATPRRSSRDGGAARAKVAPTTATARPNELQEAQARRGAAAAWTYDRTCCALTADEIARREAATRPARFDSAFPTGRRPSRSRARAIEFDNAQHRRLRHPPFGRPADLSPVRRGRRHRHGDHPRRPRRRSHLEHAEAVAAVSRVRRARAGVRARAADPRAGQEAPEQAPRRDVGDRVPASGISAGGDGQFSGVARLVARRRSRGASRGTS